MTVIEHLRRILAESIEPQLASADIYLTGDRSGNTIARYSGRRNNFDCEVTVVRDKWWSKNRGRFTIFFVVSRTVNYSTQGEMNDDDSVEANLGCLIGDGTQDWKIWATDDAEPFVETLSAGMRDYGIPWLERVSTDRGFDKYQADERY
ncbi:hypothetical protein [Planctomycetes bacterium TBK1r]|uniref:Uncharacterized protein n=1 Tax=Stieleria magnilauensis TaxID=2527963 RepID=A0ABX5Y4B2_9BACT|nr:hypothetical protein TBK1r_78320 [Planctomycetes bacterium TBK1r]